MPWVWEGFHPLNPLPGYERVGAFLMNLNRAKHSRAKAKNILQVSRSILWINLNMNYLRLTSLLASPDSHPTSLLPFLKITKFHVRRGNANRWIKRFHA